MVFFFMVSLAGYTEVGFVDLYSALKYILI
jgi:hypothetical protein